VRSAQCGSAVRSAVFFTAQCARKQRTAFTHCARFHRSAFTKSALKIPQCGPQAPHRGTAVRSSPPALRPRPVAEPRPVASNPLPTGKKTPGGAGTHTGHTRAHKDKRTTQTNLTTIQTHQRTTRTSARRPKPRPTQQPVSRKPGADRSPRPIIPGIPTSRVGLLTGKCVRLPPVFSNREKGASFATVSRGYGRNLGVHFVSCLFAFLRARRARARVEGNLAPRAQKPRAL